MKSLIKSIILSGIISATFLGISACEKNWNENDLYAEVLAVSTDGTSSIIDANLKSAIVETTDPNENELAILISIREEEKLARDVYTALYLKWGNQVFSRIAAAENNHMNAVNYLLISYGSSDTLIGNPGVFTIPEIGLLYEELVAKGSVSLAEAFTTGALIEEMDISDITKTLSDVTNENILMVFENLTRGSRNHLRAFSRQLNILGLSYTPVYLSAEEYSIIINTSAEKGKQYKMKGNKRNGRGQGNGTCIQ